MDRSALVAEPGILSYALFAHFLRGLTPTPQVGRLRLIAASISLPHVAGSGWSKKLRRTAGTCWKRRFVPPVPQLFCLRRTTS